MKKLILMVIMVTVVIAFATGCRRSDENGKRSMGRLRVYEKKVNSEYDLRESLNSNKIKVGGYVYEL